MIKKKQMKKGTLQELEPGSESDRDPFEEVYRYLRRPRLRREDCPNPIPWWGVCSCFFFGSSTIHRCFEHFVLDEL